MVDLILPKREIGANPEFVRQKHLPVLVLHLHNIIRRTVSNPPFIVTEHMKFLFHYTTYFKNVVSGSGSALKFDSVEKL